MNNVDYTGSLAKNFTIDFIKNLIYDVEDGYILYEKYKILKQTDGYLVERFTDGTNIHFSRLRWAAAWAILDRYNKIIESKRIIELNNVLTSIEAEMIVHKRLQKIGSSEVKEINRDKYLVALDKQKRFQWEIDKYIIMAKNCQDKGYENELTRTPGKQKDKIS